MVTFFLFSVTCCLYFVIFISRLIVAPVDTKFNFGFVQYIWVGQQISVVPEPHGNSKNQEPYQPSMKSTRELIKTAVAKGSRPAKVHEEVLGSLGGITKIDYEGQVPRMNYVYKANSQQNTSSFQDLLEEAFKTQVTNAHFLRSIILFPEPLVICYGDRQINDMKRFLLNTETPGILTIDTTFNVGSFFATFTTYRHQMLRTKRTGIEPVMIGPVMFHQHPPSKAVYQRFAAEIKLQLEGDVKFIGSDGDSVSCK